MLYKLILFIVIIVIPIYFYVGHFHIDKIDKKVVVDNDNTFGFYIVVATCMLFLLYN